MPRFFTEDANGNTKLVAVLDLKTGEFTYYDEAEAKKLNEAAHERLTRKVNELMNYLRRTRQYRLCM